ncbi:hypothetical protein GCM10027511_42970 [Hymenobacter humi]
MLVDGVLILYTSDPTSGPMRTLVAQMQAQGREVFLKPLTQLEVKKKAHVTPALQGSLARLSPN